MPALPSSILNPICEAFIAVLPPRVDSHPLGCHRPRVGDGVVFDHLIEHLVTGAGYDRLT